MTVRRWVGVLGVVLWSMGSLAPMQASAATDGYTVEDIKLNSAGDLLGVCTVEPAHEHYTAVLAFCYGFFEGAIRYHQAISGPDFNKTLVCAPAGTTRLQGVEVFVSFIQEHPEYESEGAIDAVFRALMARWPCPQNSGD